MEKQQNYAILQKLHVTYWKMTEAGKQKNEEVGAKARHCKGIGLRIT